MITLHTSSVNVIINTVISPYFIKVITFYYTVHIFYFILEFLIIYFTILMNKIFKWLQNKIYSFFFVSLF